MLSRERQIIGLAVEPVSRVALTNAARGARLVRLGCGCCKSRLTQPIEARLSDVGGTRLLYLGHGAHEEASDARIQRKSLVLVRMNQGVR